MSQLTCRNLSPGDILLKVSDGSVLSHAIQVGQNLAGGSNAGIVHAGVMFDNTYIIEAQGPGINANDLRVQNKQYGYHVVRCTNPNIALGAGTCAKMMFDIHKKQGSMGYSLTGAIGSLFGNGGKPANRSDMDRLLDRILQGTSHRFFCSQFVVYVYQFVAEQCGIPAAMLFNMADAKVEPSELAASLSGHNSFREIGYMMPGHR